MAKDVKRRPDPNNLQEFIMWVTEELSTLKNEVKWIKYILYVVILLLAALIGIRF